MNFKTKTALAVSSLGLLALPLVASADTATSTVSVDVVGVISAFTTSGTVTLGAITPDATGRQSTNKDTVSATTNDSQGLNITLQDSDTTYTLTSGTDTIAKAAGTYAVPAALANGEWGWRVDSLGSFGVGPTAVLSSAAPSALTYAGIPANGVAQQIKNITAEGSTSVEVWYSARVNNTQPSGTYTNTVLYTATVN